MRVHALLIAVLVACRRVEAGEIMLQVDGGGGEPVAGARGFATAFPAARGRSIIFCWSFISATKAGPTVRERCFWRGAD